jgi:hypothetical protein
MACLTETGRLLDISPMKFGKGVLEFVNGSWVPATKPVWGDEIFNARKLSDAELEKLLKSGKFK